MTPALLSSAVLNAVAAHLEGLSLAQVVEDLAHEGISARRSHVGIYLNGICAPTAANCVTGAGTSSTAVPGRRRRAHPVSPRRASSNSAAPRHDDAPRR
jgi:hypothetical protein